MALFPDEQVRTLAEFADALSRVRSGNLRWFRGQSRTSYRLIPSLARRKGAWLDGEPILMKRFQQNAAALVGPGSRDDWDWMLLMQHYGVPTRLLDWSENPLAALYFAIISSDGKVNARSDGIVWVLDPVALNVAANIPSPPNDIPILGFEPNLDQYLPSAVANTITSLGPIAVLARRQFPRLVAQAGVFTVMHRNPISIHRVRRGDLVGKIIVPRQAKDDLRRELMNFGVSRLTLFPELESVAAVATSYL